MLLLLSLSHVQLFETPWTAARQTSLSFTISQSLLKFMFLELVMPSNYLMHCHPPSPPAFNLSLIRVFSNESVLHIRWQRYLSFNFSISPSNEYSGLISFMLTGLLSLQSKELSRVFSSMTVQKHQVFNAQPSLWSNFHIHIWLPEKTIAFKIWTFAGKVMSLIFNM